MAEARPQTSTVVYCGFYRKGGKGYICEDTVYSISDCLLGFKPDPRYTVKGSFE